MTPEIETPAVEIVEQPQREPWVTPEITSFDAVAVTQGTSILLGDFLNSAS